MDQRIDFLKKNPFFKDFSIEDLTELLKASTWNKYEFNEMILHQYDMSDKDKKTLFVIVLGKIVVLKEGKPIAELKEGDIFGEVTFLKGQARVADVVSKAKQVIIIGVNQQKFGEINPESHSCFYKRLAEVILDRYLFHKNRDTDKQVKPFQVDQANKPV